MIDELASLPCLACGCERFDVLATPTEVDAERGWLLEFHSQRVEGGRDSLKDRVEFTQSNTAFVVRCVVCGTVMRNPQPTPQALRRLYRFDTYGEEALEALLENEREFFQAKAARFQHVLPPKSRVLEVGSFVGAFLMAAEELGWIAKGVDVGEETTAFCHSKGLDVLRGEIGDVQDGPYDAVFVWNTFDQTNEPGVLLDAAYRLLKPEGTLVLRIPNGRFASSCAELMSNRHRPDAVRTALAYNNFLTFPYLAGYTLEGVRELVARHGFLVCGLACDTILPLSTPDTLPWAREEERRVKRKVVRASERCERLKGQVFHPWLDLLAVIA